MQECRLGQPPGTCPDGLGEAPAEVAPEATSHTPAIKMGRKPTSAQRTPACDECKHEAQIARHVGSRDCVKRRRATLASPAPALRKVIGKRCGLLWTRTKRALWFALDDRKERAHVG